MNDEEIRVQAIEFAKQNKLRVAKKLTDPTIYEPDAVPISVFMAGSPGAGKTEFSKSLIGVLERDQERRVVRIDGDEVRPLIPGYTGGNSHLFQGAVSLIVEKMHDLVLHEGQSFILDGTFANYDKAADNIRRSLAKSRPVLVFYIYQKPEVAWRFTQAREEAEGRNIPKSAFVEQFLGAKETVGRVAAEFGERATIFFVKKDYEKNAVEHIAEVGRKTASIDGHIEEHYTKSDLEKRL